MITNKIPILCVGIFCLLASIAAECGYKTCHPTKEGYINIHLVPHSHDDLGWLKTFEQYYYGSHDFIQAAGVQYILSSVVDALQKNSDRRFVYVETGFFWKWWLHQDNTTRGQVIQLVNEGRLEFIGGGWSMNDEAASYYQNTIDQMTWGLRRLNDTFGECGRPKVGWQIDPFGHSREMASIFAQLGYDGFFLNRIDYQDHDNRTSNKGLEFVWRGSPDNLGESTDIYTNVLFRHYGAPGGMCFDIRCTDEPVVDDRDSPEYNADQKVQDFINDWINPARSGYVSDNLLVTMGDDFQYQYAGKNFVNMDKFIKHMNSREFDGIKYNAMYSTPSCYLKAVFEATNGTLSNPLKTDDFFPYASSAHTYWTGYFSSRPTGKAYSRFTNNFLQIVKQLGVFTNRTSDEDVAKLENLREALAVFQHHDGITGTEREHVAHDYMHLLHQAITKGEQVAGDALGILAGATGDDFTTCHMLNISECPRTETEDSLIITLYNPLGRYVDKYVRLPISDNTSQIVVTDPDGTELITQTVPVHPSVLAVPGRNSSAKFELVFKAENLPPLGYKQFYYQEKETASIPLSNPTRKTRIEIKQTEEGPKVVATSRRGLQLTAKANYYFYTGYVGDQESSDPYAFRPDPNVTLQPIPHLPNYDVYDGPLVTETHYQFNDWFSCVLRQYENSLIEISHLVGPLPFIDNHGTEVIAKFRFEDLEYDDKIFTDTNGRETIERVRNFRPTWNVSIEEPESGNYYPIVSGISIGNATAGVAVLNDRAQGGGSLSYQSLEFMIHRNTIKDGKGVGEALNESAYGTGLVSRGSHYFVFTGTDFQDASDQTAKELAQQISLDSWIFFSSPNGKSFADYNKTHKMEYSGLSNSSVLPRNVHVLTLEPWGPSTVLLRLENFVGKDDAWHSGTSTVNIQDLFSAFRIKSLRETTLGANQWLEDNARIRFNWAGSKEQVKLQADFKVTLEPMQIRTFVIDIAYD